MPEPQNPIVARAATRPAAAPEGRFLLGIVTRDGRTHALLREADGRIRKLFPGDRVGTANVVAIGETGLHLADGPAEIVLTIPG